MTPVLRLLTAGGGKVQAAPEQESGEDVTVVVLPLLPVEPVTPEPAPEMEGGSGMGSRKFINDKNIRSFRPPL